MQVLVPCCQKHIKLVVVTILKTCFIAKNLIYYIVLSCSLQSREIYSISRVGLFHLVLPLVQRQVCSPHSSSKNVHIEQMWFFCTLLTNMFLISDFIRLLAVIVHLKCCSDFFRAGTVLFLLLLKSVLLA